MRYALDHSNNATKKLVMERKKKTLKRQTQFYNSFENEVCFANR